MFDCGLNAYANGQTSTHPTVWVSGVPYTTRTPNDDNVPGSDDTRASAGRRVMMSGAFGSATGTAGSVDVDGGRLVAAVRV